MIPPGNTGSIQVWMVVLTYVGIVFVGILSAVALAARLIQKPPNTAVLIAQIKNRAWPLGELFQLLLILFSLFIMVVSARQISAALISRSFAVNPRIWVVAQSISFHWIGLGLIFLFLKGRHTSWDEAFGFTRMRVLRLLLAGGLLYFVTMPLVWFYTLIYQLVLQRLGVEFSWQDIALVLTGAQPFWMRVYLLFLGIILAPIFEEILFRGILLPTMARIWGIAPAVLISSILFAAIHLHIPSLMPLMIIAIAFSLAYLYTGSLIVPIVMHSIFNGVNLVLMIILRNC